MINERKPQPSVMFASYGLTAGGGETFPIFLANGLRLDGWPVAFLDCGYEPVEPGIRELLAPHVPLYHLAAEGNIGSLCHQIGIDVVHSCHTGTDQIVQRNLRGMPERIRPKHVVTLHGGYETLALDDLLACLPALNHVDHFTYAAAKNLRSFPERFVDERPFTRIANALPQTESGAHERSELGIAADALVVILISRAIPGKGWDVARSAIELVRPRTDRDIQLILIGDGPIYDAMLTEGVPDWIHPLGFQSDIRSWIELADLALLPTTFAGESFPLVLIDFLTLGVPVVASAAGEIPEMMKSQEGVAGHIVDIDGDQLSPDEFARHIEDFANLGDRERDDLRRRALSAAEKFDFAAMIHSYQQVYSAVTTGR